IEKKIVSVITEIGLDHTEYLGDTKEKIAFEKAGIIKENTPVVFINKEESVSDVIRAHAKELNAPVYEVSNTNIKNYETNGAGIDFSIQSLYDEFVELVLNTKALYQTENALIAFRTLEVLSKDFPYKLNREDIVKGFSQMKWPGRMETVADRFVIDGGHNEDGIKAFLESVKAFGDVKKELLYSAVSDKDIEKAASLIKESNLFEKIYVCKLSGSRASGLDRLKEAFKECENVEYFDNVAEGIGEMISKRSGDTYSFAVGSLYLVGEIKALIYEEEIL
ncbi:MAG: bifunctional folylpolyglutamate synthase/dihydrofolate synthase, partial [Lachnospiraceae bacterium]|nr:bifunctional folylpolyglutamate synthase/dihydrofolate synthase [Lachnospiraceae bacterium]